MENNNGDKGIKCVHFKDNNQYTDYYKTHKSTNKIANPHCAVIEAGLWFKL